MENKLEQLLNSLIEKGWKPFGRFDKLMTYGQDRGRKVFGFGVLGEVEYSLRELVSKESGLWQFVCENGMIKKQKGEKFIEIYDNAKCETEGLYDDSKSQYRLIESALKDESELEQFLLDNITV